MVTHPPMENTAKDLLQQRWNQNPDCIVAECPVWMLPDLIDLIAQSPDHHAAELAPHIERMLLEQNFVDENGDSIVADAEDHAHRQAELITAALEELRLLAIQEGQWSPAPVTPIMFG